MKRSTACAVAVLMTGALCAGSAQAQPDSPGPIGWSPLDVGPPGVSPLGPGPLGVGPLGIAPFAGEAIGFAPDGQADREAAQRARDRDRQDRLYEEGQRAIEEGRWQSAAERFADLAAQKGTRSDAAMYWRAYALDRMGQKADALTAAAELIKQYPASKWLADAKALELQVRQSAGQPVRPEAEGDEELKLLALQGLQHSDPEQAVPMIEKILQGPQSPRLKQRALFVLAQSNSPRARQVLTNIARGGSNPDLQRRAIQYLGVHGGRENREILAQIYESSTDVDVKRRILRSFAVSGDRARVLAAATGEGTPELRAEAVQQLGVMRAHDELWQLYQKESATDIKRRIIQAMFVGGNVTRMTELANNEQNVDLRRAAIRNLGLMGSSRSGDTLTALYAKEKDVAIKKEIVNAFFLQNNGEQLVAIARKETDPVMQKDIVGRLSLMPRSKVALAYLMEILNK
ncbi:MAG TPA: HEAT repeat domain-containing protein [Vicinamibacterales bacterium]|nr:HEAT repeat domain-containing protein [Vicinamibacterales bacterium]